MTDEPDKPVEAKKKPEPRRPGGKAKRGVAKTLAAKKSMKKAAKK